MNTEATKKYIAEFCDGYDYPQEAKECFLTTFDKVTSSKSGKDFFAPIDNYNESYEPICTKVYLGKIGVSGRVADEIGCSVYTTDFLFFLCMTPGLEKRYEKEGVDKEIFYDSMLDLKCKLAECKRVYGIWGSFVAGWFTGFFNMKRFGLGRLQYEIVPHIWAHKKFAPGVRVRLWQKIINIHIPSSGPLDHDAVIASYKKAYAFYRQRGFGKNIVFHTSSWLLNPDHEKMLPPDSNIRKFIADFYRISVTEEPTNGDFWRIYNRPYDKNRLDVSGDTTMQKGYAEILKQGKHIKSSSGIFVYDGEKFYK